MSTRSPRNAPRDSYTFFCRGLFGRASTTPLGFSHPCMVAGEGAGGPEREYPLGPSVRGPRRPPGAHAVRAGKSPRSLLLTLLHAPSSRLHTGVPARVDHRDSNQRMPAVEMPSPGTRVDSHAQLTDLWSERHGEGTDFSTLIALRD